MLWLSWLLFSIGCSDPRLLEGKVTDVWGNPLHDATVVVEGVVERYRTDASGAFRIEIAGDVKVGALMAGKDGFIKGITDVAAPDPEADFAPVAFKLYPEPDKPGFYAVGRESYTHLKTTRLTVIGTELKHYVGVKEYPESHISAMTREFVFTSTLRPSELAQMNLHLSRLDFVDHTGMKGVLGDTDATVNLFVAQEEIPFDLKALPSRDDYLLVLRSELKAGVYAFHGQNILNETDYRIVHDLPKEMQVVFPFEIK